MFVPTIFMCAIFLTCGALKDTFLAHEYYVNVVLDLKRHYKSDCLVIINSNGFSNSYQTAEMRKLLSRNDAMTMHIAAHNLQETVDNFRCRSNRPLYILFANSVTIRHLRLLRRIPSYPRWLLFIENKAPSATNHQFLDDIYVPFNCEFLVAESYSSSIQLTEVYQVADGMPATKHHFGSWSQSDGLEFLKEPLYSRRFNLEGLVLRAVTLRYTYPEAFLVSDNKQMLSRMELYGKIWLSMEERYNFTTVIFESSRRGFGFFLNGSWDGMMSIVVEQEADLAINTLTYDQERIRSVDFLTPISTSKIYLIVRKPSTLQFQWANFLSPFSLTLWLTVLGSILLFGISLTATHRAAFAIGYEERCRADEFHLSNSLFHVLGLYCTQGPSMKPSTFSIRSVLLLSGLTSVVITAAYSGALTSFMTVQKLDLPYETIDEYIDDPTYNLEISQNGFWIYLNVYMKRYLLNSRVDLYRKLYEKMENKVEHMAINKLYGFKRVCDRSKFGWFGSYSANDKFLKMITCELVTVPGYLRVDFESIILTKQSPYTKLFNRNLLYLRWSGLMDRFVRSSKLGSVNEPIEKLSRVNLQQVVPIIAVLAAGVLISLFAIFVEMMIFFNEKLENKCS